VEAMAKDLTATLEELVRQADLRKKINKRQYISETIGEFTINDILKELEKPGRDPRDQIEEFRFDDTIKTIDDLKVGMTVPGLVTNITNFGAFVDIGVKQDGLVHISQLSNTFVSDPGEIVKLQQRVMVTVTEVDVARKRIALTMKTNAGETNPGNNGGKASNKIQGRGNKRQGTGAVKKEEALDPFQAKLSALKKKFS
jgi:uncharacterized protein